MHNQIFVMPSGTGYWMEYLRQTISGDYKILSGRYVSFDKVVWC